MERTAAVAGLNPVPRCRRRNATAKIQPVKGLRMEIFPKGKYYPPLDWMDRWRDRKNSIRKGMEK